MIVVQTLRTIDLIIASRLITHGARAQTLRRLQSDIFINVGSVERFLATH